MSYTDVFTSSNVYPSELSYAAVTLTEDIVLSWPEETSESSNLAARIMDVTPDAASRIITLPNAAKSAPGNTILFNNRGAYTFTVNDADSTQVVTIAPGTLWQIYLTSNTTTAGVWETLQYGAATSIANASALAGTGIAAVGTTLSQAVPITTFSLDYLAGIPDRAKFYNWIGAAGTLTLPQPATAGNDWFMYLRNSGSGAIKADAPGTSLIDGMSYVSFQPGESAIIASDGSDFYTVGYGQQAIFAFDYTVISVAGSGNYTLTSTELNRVSYKFTGVLTGNRVVVVPATVQQYWVDNETTGAYTLSVKASGGVSLITVAAGSRAILYCDGSEVLKADTGGIATPIAVVDGGTGATTASNARINLGGTSVGVSLFTASSQAAAWAALGVAPSGVIDGGTF